MEIKSGQKTLLGSNATVVLESGDHVSVAYKDPLTGQFNVFNIHAQHLVFIATHEQSDNTLLVRRGGCEMVQG